MPVQKKVKKSAKSAVKNASPKVTNKPKEFLPVLLETGEKTALPIEAVITSAVFDPNKTYPGSDRNVAVTIERDKQTSCYYVRASDIERYILNQDKTPADFERVNSKAIEMLHELKKAWVKFGTAILEVNAIRSYRTKYQKFQDFCEKELKLHPSTVYEVMNSTLFLMQEKPEVYKALMQGDTKMDEVLPSYRSLYLVARKKKQLEKKKKYEELVNDLLKGKLSTRELQKEIRKILHGEEKPSWNALMKNFEKACAELENFEVSKDIKIEAQNFFEKLKKIEL